MVKQCHLYQPCSHDWGSGETQPPSGSSGSSAWEDGVYKWGFPYMGVPLYRWRWLGATPHPWKSSKSWEDLSRWFFRKCSISSISLQWSQGLDESDDLVVFHSLGRPGIVSRFWGPSWSFFFLTFFPRAWSGPSSPRVPAVWWFTVGWWLPDGKTPWFHLGLKSKREHTVSSQNPRWLISTLQK